MDEAGQCLAVIGRQRMLLHHLSVGLSYMTLILVQYTMRIPKNKATNATPCNVLHRLFATLPFAMPVFYEHTIDNPVYNADK